MSTERTQDVPASPDFAFASSMSLSNHATVWDFPSQPYLAPRQHFTSDSYYLTALPTRPSSRCHLCSRHHHQRLQHIYLIHTISLFKSIPRYRRTITSIEQISRLFSPFTICHLPLAIYHSSFRPSIDIIAQQRESWVLQA